MHFTTPILLGLATSSQAAPVPSLFGDLITSIIGGVENAVTTVTSTVTSPDSLAAAVAKLGVTLQTNAASHGSIFSCNQITFGQVDSLINKIAHSITWPKQNRNFVNWKTYKANGANFGAWLEQVRMTLLAAGDLLLTTPGKQLRSRLVGSQHRPKLS